MKKIVLILSLFSISLCCATVDELLQNFSQKYKIAQEAEQKAKSASMFTRNKALRNQIQAEEDFNEATKALAHELEAIEARAKEISKTSSSSKKLMHAQQLLNDLKSITKIAGEAAKATGLPTSTLLLSLHLNSAAEAVNSALAKLMKS